MDYYRVALKRLGIIEVTCWSRFEKGLLFHNHIEPGHAAGSYPKGDAGQTKMWSGFNWSKKYTYAVAGSKPLQLDRPTNK